jgi:hypothetical protein
VKGNPKGGKPCEPKKTKGTAAGIKTEMNIFIIMLRFLNAEKMSVDRMSGGMEVIKNITKKINLLNRT